MSTVRVRFSFMVKLRVRFGVKVSVRVRVKVIIRINIRMSNACYPHPHVRILGVVSV